MHTLLLRHPHRTERLADKPSSIISVFETIKAIAKCGPTLKIEII